MTEEKRSLSYPESRKGEAYGVQRKGKEKALFSRAKKR
jgi:hypothetical protein